MMWKAHTLAHLRGYELLHFVEKLVTEDDPSLIQQDQLLLAWIFSAISVSMLHQITASRTSHKAWKMLKGIFNTRLKSRIIHLQNQLRSLRKDSLSVDDFFVKLTAISEELREAGVSIDDGELSLIALNGLDETYDPFVTAQIARVEDISFASLLSLLHSYDLRLSCHYESKGIATANSIQSSSVMICQICDKKGHPALYCFNCPSKVKPRSVQQSVKEPIIGCQHSLVSR